MKIFNFKKQPTEKDKPLDEALGEEHPEPTPVPMYILEVNTELETICSEPLTLEEAQCQAQHIGIHGAFLDRGEEPVKFIPAHRIYEIKFSKVE